MKTLQGRRPNLRNSAVEEPYDFTRCVIGPNDRARPTSRLFYPRRDRGSGAQQRASADSGGFATVAGDLQALRQREGQMSERNIASVGLRARWLLVEGLCLLNFLSFFVVGLTIGGAAPIGRLDGSHFYVGNHGRFSEVSQAVYSYSWFHALSQLITLPLLAVAVVRSRWPEKL
jgi:hypothetical protein